MERTYTTLEETKQCFDNMMSWDKEKFACLVKDYSECTNEDEKLSIKELLENNGYSFSDVVNDPDYEIDEIINDVGGERAVLEWIDESDVVRNKNVDFLLDAMDNDDIIDYVLSNDELREKILEEIND